MFITFEGGEGTGKTSIIKEINSFLVSKGYNVVLTREPGGGHISEQIRTILLDINNKNMDYKAEALLYAASRIQHLEEIILPSLKENKIVLCDRYLDSSLAYQGVARNLGINNILSINSFAIPHMPDITFFIDVKPEICFKRLANNNREMDRLDLEKMKFHEDVYNGYIEISKMYKERIICIDGDRPLDEIIREIQNHILEVLNNDKKC